MEKLHIILHSSDPASRRAAKRLSLAWKAPTLIRVRRGSHSPSVPLTVHIGLGSTLRPTLAVWWNTPFSGLAAERASALALSTAAWEGADDFEPWRALTAPPPRVPRIGAPDAGRGWLLAPTLLTASIIPLELRERVQLHFLGGKNLCWGKGDVVWWSSPRLIASLLGRAEAVVAPLGPLAFDALRAGVPLLCPSTLRAVDAPAIHQRLAGLVPPSLAGSSPLWHHVADQTRAVAAGATPAPLCTPEWVGNGRSRSHPHTAPSAIMARLQRKLRKLVREPDRFCAESRHAFVRKTGAVFGNWVEPVSSDFEAERLTAKLQLRR